MSNIEKIKAEIERLKGQLIRGACAAQIEMETNCKDEAYNEVLAFIDSLPEDDHFREPTKMVEERLADSDKTLKEAADKFAVFMKGVAEGRRLEREEREENKRKDMETNCIRLKRGVCRLDLKPCKKDCPLRKTKEETK